MFTDIEDILEEEGNEKVSHRVHSTIQKYINRIKSLEGLEKKNRIFFLDLLLSETKSKIKKTQYENERITTFLLNKIQALYRNELNIKIQQLPQDYDLSLEEKETRTHNSMMSAIKTGAKTYYNSITESVEALPTKFRN